MLLANAIGPSILPFLGPLTMGIAVFGPLTLLVAILEWRFFRRAGIDRGPFYHAVVANILSSIVGMVLVIAGSDAVLVVMFAFFGSLLLSIAIEGFYLTWVYYRYPEHDSIQAGDTKPVLRPFRWRWVILANVVSWVFLIVVDLSGTLIREELSWSQVEWWRSLAPTVNQVNAVICIALLGWLVTWPLHCAMRSTKPEQGLTSEAADSFK